MEEKNRTRKKTKFCKILHMIVFWSDAPMKGHGYG